MPPVISHRSVTSLSSIAHSHQATWSLTTAAPNESSEHLISSASVRWPQYLCEGSSTLPPQSSRERWTFEYGDEDSESSSDPPEDERALAVLKERISRINTENVTRKFPLLPAVDLIVSPTVLEKDDDIHDPIVKDLTRASLQNPLKNKRGLIDGIGMLLVVVGVSMILIGLPIISRIEEMDEILTTCEEDPDCIRAGLPLLKNVRYGPIDPDTPASVMTRTDVHGNMQNLVFSDEFNKEGRTFYTGDDPYFSGVDLWYGVTADLEWYDPDAISTANGTLNIRFDAFPNHDLSYRSGMLQSWNKLCFKGGYLEANISLPGSGEVPGLWPGFWAMGNLGRPGFAATTDGMWPYSYWDQCDAGITANQSLRDDLSYLPGMRLPACTCNSSNTSLHPTPGKSRSAPELDILEGNVAFLGASQTSAVGTGSQSLQVAPFDIAHVPDYDYVELFNRSITTMNGFRGSPYQESISAITNLNNSWYDGNAYQTYGMEYQPGSTGYITFFVSDSPTWHIDGAALKPNGNVGQRLIPVEPMALVINLGMSPTFANIDWPGLHAELPATMRVDYVRIYQNTDDPTLGHALGCDPPGYASTKYIAEHPKAYLDPNRTLWGETGYEWPRNRFVDVC